MGKKTRRTITITITETWHFFGGDLFWRDQAEESSEAVIEKFNKQIGQDNVTGVVFSTHISNYQESNITTAESRAFIQRYAEALSGKAKPASVVNQYVADSDAALKQHIAEGEAAFPHYELVGEDLSER